MAEIPDKVEITVSIIPEPVAIHQDPICIEYAAITRRIADAVRRGHMEHARRLSDERAEFAAEHPVETSAWEEYYDAERR